MSGIVPRESAAVLSWSGRVRLWHTLHLRVAESNELHMHRATRPARAPGQQAQWWQKLNTSLAQMYEFTYQRCTELPIWPDYDPQSGFFNPNVTDFGAFFVPYCEAEYGKGVRPQKNGEANWYYGGPDLYGKSAGNIIFISDLLDPSYVWQPFQQLSNTVTALHIPGCSRFSAESVNLPTPTTRADPGHRVCAGAGAGMGNTSHEESVNPQRIESYENSIPRIGREGL